MPFTFLRKYTLLHSAPPAVCAVSVDLHRKHHTIQSSLAWPQGSEFQIYKPRTWACYKNKKKLNCFTAFSLLPELLPLWGHKEPWMQLQHILQRLKDPQFLHSGKCLPLILQEPQKLKKHKLSSKYAALQYHLETSNFWPETNFGPQIPWTWLPEFLDFTELGTFLCGVRGQARTAILDWQGTLALLQLKWVKGYNLTNLINLTLNYFAVIH